MSETQNAAEVTAMADLAGRNYRMLAEIPLRVSVEVGSTARRLSEQQSLEHILPSIVDRLPDRASRELAFGLAAAVVVSDGRTPSAELNILKALQDMFDLTEEDVARLFETAQSKGQFPPTQVK